MRTKRKQPRRKTIDGNSIIDKSEEVTVSTSQPKSILRRRFSDASASLKGHMHSEQKVKWDEKNLQKTEKEKQEFKHIVINEPKTPYIYYPGSNESSSMDQSSDMYNYDDLPSLALSSDAVSPNTNVSNIQRQRSNSLEHNAGTSGSEWDESDHESKQVQEHRQKFEQLRTQHYRIGDLLRQSRNVDDQKDG